jgi:aminoglycoside phosphotransferase
MLEFSDVARYLIGRGSLCQQAVVEDGIVVRDVSSRHRNFRVDIQSGGGFHLKQESGPVARAQLQREANIYRNLQKSDPRFAAFMPQILDYDEESGVLILGLVPDAEDLLAYHYRTRQFPAQVGAAIGEALAALHAVGAQGSWPCPQPSFLGVYRPSLEIFREASAANLQLIGIIQASSHLCARLDSVRKGLRRETLLHNDIKWSNLLLSGESLKVVDWEAADYGDPAWDLGSVFGQYLSCWVFSIPVSTGNPAENFADLATLPLAAMKGALHACWTAYFTTRGLSFTAAGELLLRAIGLTGVRLLQTVYESSQFAARLTSNDILHIQLASNMLERPIEAGRHLLGLPVRGIG